MMPRCYVTAVWLGKKTACQARALRIKCQYQDQESSQDFSGVLSVRGCFLSGGFKELDPARLSLQEEKKRKDHSGTTRPTVSKFQLLIFRRSTFLNYINMTRL